ncbi:hypothetical protein [Roseospirillum parvum]|uniref:EAL domain-containing protein n=1 Tax=Roseospirillum parvum TaxID=83401 RepID=A0A1G7ZTL8_9PROT|nr:hypothetical protein [Roseospirillum parvum]SDH11510.1 EAL domain-containing protein [Roseospirillum parvum]
MAPRLPGRRAKGRREPHLDDVAAFAQADPVEAGAPIRLPPPRETRSEGRRNEPAGADSFDRVGRRVARFAAHPGRMALIVHLSRLAAEHRQPLLLAVALEAFESRADGQDLEVHPLPNGDLVVLYAGRQREAVATALLEVRCLFADDALISPGFGLPGAAGGTLESMPEDGDDPLASLFLLDRQQGAVERHLANLAVAVNEEKASLGRQAASRAERLNESRASSSRTDPRMESQVVPQVVPQVGPDIAPATPDRAPATSAEAAPPEELAVEGTLPVAASVRRDRGSPLTPDLLARTEAILEKADLSAYLRRQSVAAILGGERPDPVFSEIYVSIEELRRTILPTVDLAANPWLFRRLTHTLDQRVLAVLARNDDRSLEAGFSINLNVRTLLSEAFLRFDDSVASGQHTTVVLEIGVEDICADVNAFLFARDFARQRGYRVCVDGLTWRTLPVIDVDRLGVDLAKIYWEPELARRLSGPDGHGIAAMLQKARRRRLILGHCDSAEAIRLGQQLGIGLFQGRHVENLIRPGAVV